ncbi:MAG: type II secretion system secretin GspD [Marinicella sp.]
MINNLTRTFTLTIGFFALAGCVSQPKDLTAELDNSNYLEGIKSTAYSGEVFNEGGEVKASREDAEYFPGTGEFINFEAAARKDKPVSEQGEITFNFEGESLQAVVHFILGQVLKENYVLAPGVNGKVTFATAKPISKEQLIPILEMMLSWNNAALVMVGDRYHVLPQNQAIKGLLTPKFSQAKNKAGFQVLAVPLEYVSPTEMEKILAPYAKDGAVVKADNSRNIIFLSGTASELSNYLHTVEIFDVDWLAGMSTGIFYLQRVDANDIITELEALFGEGAENPLAGMFRFLPLERLNAVMVITPQEDYLHKAKVWVDRLDRADADGASNLYVYSVKNIKADDLAGYLSDVFGGSGGSSSAKASGGSVVPGQEGREVSSQNAKKTNTTKRRTNNNSDNDIHISAIEDSNQLLIKAGVSDYEKILSAIERLDIEPLQVLLEMKIIEVSLDGSLEHGVELLFGDQVPSSGGESGTSKFYNFSTAGASINGTTGAFYNLVENNAMARVSALESEGRAAILSSPSIMVLNNKNATINVGDQIPITNVGTINNGGGTNNGTIQNTRFIQTGVQVDITPRVNPGGLVYLEISQDVSNAKSLPPGSTATPPITTRALITEIAVQSGNTIVMGGLISDENRQSRSGFPLLSKIPVIGNAFGSKNKSNNRTELLLLITPTVIANPEQARMVTREYAKKFQGLKPIEKKSNNNNENDQ